MKIIKKTILILHCFFIATIINNTVKAGNPLFPNSVVSNDIDFILETDPTVYRSLAFLRRENKEMPDSRNDNLFDNNTFVFEASFADGGKIQIWCHSSFGTQAAAQAYAEKLCPRLGKLPDVQRKMIDHVVIHKGNATAFAETDGRFFVLYSDNMDARISTHDLEETVFHESVHASIQGTYKTNADWKSAQRTDAAYVTDYAKSLPDLEDMPETALFAYTLLMHPQRLSADIETWLTTNIPNRIAFFRTIYGAIKSDIQQVYNRTTIYLNPTNNMLTINTSLADKELVVKIYNYAGVLKLTEKVSHNNQLNVAMLDAGVYILTTSNGEILRFVISK